MSVKERIIEYLKFKKISKSEFGRTINVSSAFITSMRSSIQPDKIKRIALNFPDLNTEWLLTGEGNMLKEPKEAKAVIESPALTLGNTVTMSREVFELILSQQKTMQMQQERIRQLESRLEKGDAPSNDGAVAAG